MAANKDPHKWEPYHRYINYLCIQLQYLKRATQTGLKHTISFKEDKIKNTILLSHIYPFCTRGKQGNCFANTSQDSPIVWKKPCGFMGFMVINISRITLYMSEVLINTDLSSLFLNIYRERYQNVYIASQCKRNKVNPDCSLLTTEKQSELVIQN